MNWTFIFTLFIFMFIVTSCLKEDPKEDVNELEVLISVGVFGGSTPSPEFEYIYNGEGGLQYFWNENQLGIDDQGVEALLVKLRMLDKNAEIQLKVINPLGVYLSNSGKVTRDRSYPYPYVENLKLRKQVAREMERVTGVVSKLNPVDNFH